VFVALYRSASNYKSAAPFKAYLYRIARNACLTYLGKVKRIAPISAASSRYDAATERPGDKPEDSAIRTEAQKKIRTAMAGLTEKQRTALYLSHFNGLTYSEIAYVLDCPIGTVRSRISSAHAALKRALSGERDSCDITREAVNPDD
jgi:RNA polymerase sigma-70 factor (ECF subfamily)